MILVFFLCRQNEWMKIETGFFTTVYFYVHPISLPPLKWTSFAFLFKALTSSLLLTWCLKNWRVDRNITCLQSLGNKTNVLFSWKQVFLPVSISFILAHVMCSYLCESWKSLLLGLLHLIPRTVDRKSRLSKVLFGEKETKKKNKKNKDWKDDHCRGRWNRKQKEDLELLPTPGSCLLGSFSRKSLNVCIFASSSLFFILWSLLVVKRTPTSFP